MRALVVTADNRVTFSAVTDDSSDCRRHEFERPMRQGLVVGRIV
jgi:hypothetical protein